MQAEGWGDAQGTLSEEGWPEPYGLSLRTSPSGIGMLGCC